ncbi:tRNA dihydrouridine synthase DusB [Phormidium tenue]|uniref:tRNA-dihydrouridine synthase n=1 Tax=Phormidium tenue NIES-30 TaxID=549789 RepID=A0A1U7JC02_9CYAN|nr:tRNA dihydrouridine synthase DusB [Phormidium tenue]MBD2230110.1 tRNA dihydrouridine synthase DusB [Phormidium tenue FACHB-1052]OKH51256.1 tRNA dihydrouridine synthase DusB [Phormidium tenue NIES-30]
MVSLSSTILQRLQSPLVIGSVTIQSRVLQAPLSGVTDRAFRQLVRRYAPVSMLYTEMVQATGVCHAQQLEKIMDIDSGEQPISIQLFDCRPDFMADAARKAVAEGAKTIDINMGCPVNKITKKGGGSSLLRQPEVAEAIVRTVAVAVPVPVTVKTRLGWDDEQINAVEFARRMEAAGAQMLTLHGRTRSQGYHGPARWDWIARVKDALSIPVIANGDIVSVESAARCLQETGADGVMCSRGTLGYPFLVGEIDSFLKTGVIPLPPSSVVVLRCAREHLGLLWQYKGQKGIHQARKHMAWYVKGFEGAAPLRQQLCQIDTVEAGYDLLDGAIAQLEKAAAPDAIAPVEPQTLAPAM